MALCGLADLLRAIADELDPDAIEDPDEFDDELDDDVEGIDEIEDHVRVATAMHVTTPRARSARRLRDCCRR